MCVICSDEFDESNDKEYITLLPECNHVFHPKCIKKWLTECKNTCPMCNKEVNLESYDNIKNTV